MNGTILGQVVMGAARRPVPGAKVVLRGPLPGGAVLSLQTRSDGAFVARDLVPGQWEVAAAGAARVVVDVLARATTPVMLELQSGAPAQLAPDLATWQAPALPAGTVAEPDIYLERPGDQSMDTVSCDAGQDLIAASSDWPEPAQGAFQLRRSGAAVGLVRDVRQGRSVANATITCFSSHGSAPDIAPISDAAGRFYLDGLSEGLWIIRAVAEDGRAGESVLAVRAGMRSHVEIELDAPGGPDSITGLL